MLAFKPTDVICLKVLYLAGISGGKTSLSPTLPAWLSANGTNWTLRLTVSIEKMKD